MNILTAIGSSFQLGKIGQLGVGALVIGGVGYTVYWCLHSSSKQERIDDVAQRRLGESNTPPPSVSASVTSPQSLAPSLEENSGAQQMKQFLREFPHNQPEPFLTETTRDPCYIQPLQSIETLAKEYKSGNIATNIPKISEKYAKWHPIRGDGNCYYRALVFGLFSRIAKEGPGSPLIEKFIKLLEQCDSSESCKTIQRTMEQFRDKRRWFGQPDPKEALFQALSQNRSVNEQLIGTLRDMASTLIQANASVNGVPVQFAIDLQSEKDFASYCKQHVETMGENVVSVVCDLLPFALGICVETVNADQILLRISKHGVVAQPPLISLLYRGNGHYDLLIANPGGATQGTEK